MWGNALHKYVHDKLDDVIDMELGMTYSYTRRYDRGAYLGSHVDRPSCEISATLCLSYQTDDNTPWTLYGSETIRITFLFLTKELRTRVKI